MSEMFVFCSGRFVLLASGMGHERVDWLAFKKKMICSEMFVFCSGLLVSLTFGLSCQRSRLSEIRWLNVDQVTSTRLWLDRDRTRSRSKLVMSESFVLCSSLLVSLAFEFCHR